MPPILFIPRTQNFFRTLSHHVQSIEIQSTSFVAILLFISISIFLLLLIAVQAIRGSAILYQDEISISLSTVYSVALQIITSSYAFTASQIGDLLLVYMLRVLERDHPTLRSPHYQHSKKYLEKINGVWTLGHV
jgi:hypothetical protein